jgi:hypothetical protein
LVTPSPDDSSVRVLFQSPRTFRMWRYGVGHSQLLLRATPDSDEPRCIDLHFEGVAAVQLGTRYTDPEMCLGTDEERAVLDALAQRSAGARRIALALRTETGTGLVLCRRVRVLRGGTDPFGEIEDSEVLWSHRA